MRTTKRFTPNVLDRFKKQGRGLGTQQNFKPWHRVGRGDPSSIGRSHLQMWDGRQREVLSDKEWTGLFFAVSLPNLFDVLEQYPLSHAAAAHELSKYMVDASQTTYPGTIELAERLGIKHPKTSASGNSVEWVMSTDLLLVLRSPSGKFELLAVSIKTDEDFSKKRTKELLNLEREYWISRGITWLLITPSLYDKQVGLRLRDTMPWAIEHLLCEDDLVTAATVATELQGRSLTHVLEILRAKFGGLDYAQRAFWQAVWCGKIPLDLRRGWRPHIPITLLSDEEFIGLNPIASRRSSWI